MPHGLYRGESNTPWHISQGLRDQALRAYNMAFDVWASQLYGQAIGTMDTIPGNNKKGPKRTAQYCNILLDDAMALCGHPCYRISDISYDPPALRFLTYMLHQSHFRETKYWQAPSLIACGMRPEQWASTQHVVLPDSFKPFIPHYPAPNW